jgi:hypothetical protein
MQNIYTFLIMLLATLCKVSVVYIQYKIHTLGYFVVAHEAMVGCFVHILF